MIPSRLRLTLFVLLFTACGPSVAPAPAPAPAAAAVPEDGEAWVEATLAAMTLREKVGQLVVPWIDGAYIARGDAAWERARGWVADHGVGGLIVSVGPPLEIASKLNLLQREAAVPLLVAADLERGPAQRLTGGTVLPYGIETGGGTDFPPIMALGAADDERLAYAVGRVTAREARAVGIHMVYGPVVDVNNNPDNPIINTRSYGADPQRVARLGAAHVRGLQEHGVLATAKHFPGHGDTEVDSHIGLPVIHVGRARLDSLELVPFRAAVDAGVSAVMAAHVAFPSLTGDSLPATLSPELATRLLRDELGFQGLVVVDALDMGAITERFPGQEAAVRALHAGADVLLMPLDVGATIDAVVDAVRNGAVDEARIDRSVRKLLALKAALGLHRERTVPLERVHDVVGSPEHLALADTVAERGVTLVRDRRGTLPLRPHRQRHVLGIVYTDDVDPFAGRTLRRELAARFQTVQTAILPAEPHPARLEELRVRADSADVVVFAPFIRVRDRKGGLAIAEPVAELVRDIAARRPTVVASFGNPYVLTQFPEIDAYLLAWGGAGVAQRAAVRALTGEAPITATLPIPLPPHHPIGSGIRMDDTLRIARPEEVGMDAGQLARVDSIIEAAIADGAFPGATLAVGRRGRLVRLRGYGRLDHAPGSAAVDDSTLYDVASLTKVVATTTAVMMLEEDGLLDLDAPLSRYLPEWGGAPDKARVTLRHMLTHTAGFVPFLPLWRELRGPDAYLERIASLPLERAPGEASVYSDFGPILLALVVERVSGMPFERFLDQRLFGPLGMRETGFNPRQRGESVLARTAPTEVDTVFRMRHVHGDVHDENAYAIGGVAGHAGLFSSARDLAVFAQMLLDGGRHGADRLLQPETIERYTRRQLQGSSRALGWDTPAGRSSAGDLFSARSYGHTGFTGTSLWIDPDQELFVVLLTNRVNPTRENTKHIPLRRAVHDAVQQAITDTPAGQRI